jgi:serine/threonine protein kinase
LISQVALKCFDRKLTPHPERIEREIAASRAAQHENIIRFIEAFETEQEGWFQHTIYFAGPCS